MISKEIATVVFDKQFYLFLHNYFKVASIFFLDKKKNIFIHEYQNNSIDPKPVQLLVRQ